MQAKTPINLKSKLKSKVKLSESKAKFSESSQPAATQPDGHTAIQASGRKKIFKSRFGVNAALIEMTLITWALLKPRYFVLLFITSY